MKNVLHSFYYISLQIILGFFTGCGSTFHDVDMNNIKSYQYHHSIKDGLKISIDLYKEEERLSYYFGENLIESSILPVHVAVENTNDHGGYVVEKNRAMLIFDAEEGVSPPTINNNGIDSKLLTDNLSEKAVVYAASGSLALMDIGTLAGITALESFGAAAMLPAVIVCGSYFSNKERIVQNILAKELTLKSIYPGDIHSGFIYFKIEKKYLNNIKGILFVVSNISTKEEKAILVTTN